MPAALLQLGPTVRNGLDALRRRIRLSLGIRGASRLSLVFVAGSLVSFGLDRTLRLSWETRSCAWVLALTALGWVCWRWLLRPLWVALPDVELARAVERRHPSLDWRLLSSVQFADPTWKPGPETSRELAARVVADAEELSRDLAFGEAVPFDPVLRSSARGAAVLLAGILLVAAFPHTAATWAQRNLLLSTRAFWPRDTHLELEGFAAGRRSVARGSELTLRVQARGVVPARVYLEAEPLEAGARVPGGEQRLVLDALGEGRFRLVLERLSDSFRFHLAGGDDRIGPFVVEVLRRPWIEEVRLDVEPPAYTGREPRSYGLEAGSIALPVGTRVGVRVRASKPLEEAWLEEQQPGVEGPARIHTGTLVDGDGRAFTAAWELTDTRRFQIEVRDAHGFGLEAPARFSLVAEPDREPRVRLAVTRVGLNVTPGAVLAYRVEAEDDHGLGGGRLAWRVSGGEDEPREGERELEGLAGTQAAAEDTLELAALELQPKQALTLWGEARDADPAGAKTGDSPSLQLRVVTPEQLLNELLRRLFELRQELERVVGEEERLAEALEEPEPEAETLRQGAALQRDAGVIVQRGAEVVSGVVAEMMANAILDDATWSQLRHQVAEPLRTLHGGALREARTQAEAARDGQAAAIPLAAGAARDVAAELRAIAARMGRIEELAEIVAQLKRLIRRQRDLLDRTQREQGR